MSLIFESRHVVVIRDQSASTSGQLCCRVSQHRLNRSGNKNTTCRERLRRPVLGLLRARPDIMTTLQRQLNITVFHDEERLRDSVRIRLSHRSEGSANPRWPRFESIHFCKMGTDSGLIEDELRACVHVHANSPSRNVKRSEVYEDSTSSRVALRYGERD